jgi:hypothetical protein
MNCLICDRVIDVSERHVTIVRHVEHVEKSRWWTHEIVVDDASELAKFHESCSLGRRMVVKAA